MIQTLFGSLEEPEKKSIFGRMKEAVSRTRETLADRIEGIVALTHEVDEAALEELELSLLASDLGVGTSTEIIDALRARVKRHEIHNGAELKHLLKVELQAILDAREEQNFFKPRYTAPPYVIMLVGVNGTGKTTTTGKLSAYYRRQGKTVLLCAADTFRAAAIEQLEVWGQRTGVEMIRTKQGGDPSAVLFDAMRAAQARAIDVLIVDTAGRLHTKDNLMAELGKMRRTAQRIIPSAPHEVLLGDGRHHRTERAAAGPALYRVNGRHRHRAYQTRRHRERRHCRRHRSRTQTSGTLRWGGREARRPSTI